MFEDIRAKRLVTVITKSVHTMLSKYVGVEETHGETPIRVQGGEVDGGGKHLPLGFRGSDLFRKNGDRMKAASIYALD